MKPNLILGLGNPLMGDDGVGCRVAELLDDDPDTEVQCAGTDLLRWADQISGRRHVLLIDAILDDAPPGSVHILEEPFPELSSRQWNAHHLSPHQAIALLRIASPELCDTHFTLLAITIASAEVGTGLSPDLKAKLPEILDQVSGISVGRRRRSM